MHVEKDPDSQSETQSDARSESGVSSQSSVDLGFDNPFDFPLRKKWAMTVTAATSAFTCTFTTSVFSPAVRVTAAEFHVTQTVTFLGVSLYVLGFALGPVLWGPLSEFYGRRWPLIASYCGFAIMQIPIALTPNLAGLLICRIIAGCFGAGPITIVNALYADYWNPAERSIAIALHSIAVFAGPACGPIVGSFVTESKLGWRWTAWLPLIMAGAVLPFLLLLVPETYAPILKARAARHTHTNPENELQRTISAMSNKKAKSDFVRKFLLKPAAMLCCEPLLDITTLYISICYGLIYLCIFAIPYSFDVERGWDPRLGSLTFVAFLVGVMLASLTVTLYTKYYYQPRLQKRGYYIPNDRIPLIVLGGFLLPIGLFWFAWTSNKDILWVPQALSIVFIGAGIMLVYTTCSALLLDIYLSNAASAIAANTSVRSVVAACLPLAGPRMYGVLGVAWATSLLGFVCVAMIPAPFLFYKYGDRMRRRSKYAYKPPQQDW